MEGVTGLLSLEGSNVLIEYSSIDHPERAFASILKEWRKRGVKPLIVDISDTLHIFVQNLNFAGVDLAIGDIPVIKVKGTVKVGNVLGTVGVVEDFDYHLAIYSRIARTVPEDSRKHTIVLGMDKFPFQFMDEPSKLERYFETITRRYLYVKDKTSLLFLNVDVASEYLQKGLEQDSDYVIRVRNGGLAIIKYPKETRGVDNEVY